MSNPFLFGRRRTRKQRKREQLQENIRRGKIGEDIAVQGASMAALSKGRIAEVKRSGKGSDYRVRERDIITGKVKRSYLLEVKTGKAKLSQLQKKTKKKRKNYKVTHVDTFPFA